MNHTSSTTDEPRQALRRLLKNYGPEILDDPRRVEGLLRDYCPGRRREISALIAAQKERVVTELTTLREQVPQAVLTARLARRLHEQVGLTEELSRWAVETWALALGMAIEEGGCAAPAPPFPDRDPAADTDIHTSAASLTQHDDRSVDERRRREILDRIGAVLRQSQEHPETAESLRLAEQARELALAARREWTENGDVLAAVDSATAWLAQAAARGAHEAQAAGNLSLAGARLRRLLDLHPADADARGRLDRILRKRREIEQQAETFWSGGKLDKAVRLLEQLRRNFPDDSGLNERLDRRRAAAARADALVRHEIPRFKSEKRFSEIRRILRELASLGAAVKGLEEFTIHVDRQFEAAEQQAIQAQAALDRGEYGTAYGLCLRVLAVVADHEQALKIREEIGDRLHADQRFAAELQEAIEQGRFRAAHRLLRDREHEGNSPPSLLSLRHTIDERLAMLAAYWRLLAAALLGACLWLAAGWLAESTAPALVQLLRTLTAERSGLASSLQSVGGPLGQLLFAAFLLGFGGTAVCGRRSLASIGWNSVTAVVYAMSIGVVDIGWKAVDSRLIERGLLQTLIYGLFAGWLIGVWLRCSCGIRRTDVFVLGFAGSVAAGMVAGYGALTSNVHLFLCLQGAFYFAAAAVIVGLVTQVRRLVLVPIGVLLAYGLTAPMQAEGFSPYLSAVIVGVLSAGSVLAVTGQRTTWTMVVAAMVLGTLTALTTQATSNWITAPPVALLSTVWAAVLLVLSLRCRPRPEGRLFLFGLRYLIDGATSRGKVRSDVSTT